jgi:hypothetical protein
MDSTLVRTIGYVILIITFFAIAVIAIFLQFTWKETYNDKGRVLALELMKNRSEITDIIPSPEIQNKIRSAVLIDSVGIVPLYTILFLLLTWLLWFREKFAEEYFGAFFGDKSASVLFIAASLLALITCIGDSFENYHTYRMLNTAFEDLGKDAALDAAIKQSLLASRIKFIAAFLCAGILSSIFFRKPFGARENLQFTIMFSLMLLTAIFGFSCFLFYPSFLNLAMGFLNILGLVAGIWLAFFPNHFLSHY